MFKADTCSALFACGCIARRRGLFCTELVVVKNRPKISKTKKKSSNFRKFFLEFSMIIGNSIGQWNVFLKKKKRNEIFNDCFCEIITKHMDVFFFYQKKKFYFSNGNLLGNKKIIFYKEFAFFYRFFGNLNNIKTNAVDVCRVIIKKKCLTNNLTNISFKKSKKINLKFFFFFKIKKKFKQNGLLGPYASNFKYFLSREWIKKKKKVINSIIQNIFFSIFFLNIIKLV